MRTRWRSRAAALLLLCGLASACAGTRPAQRSTLQQKVGKPGGVSATELRLRLYELPARLGGAVEIAADRIRAKSADPAVWRRALLWKADGIPVIYTAALRPDPLAGALDLWVLLYQMDAYYEQGAGKDAFGWEQPIAVSAVENMLEFFEGVAASMYADNEAYLRRRGQVQDFARAHPIEGSFASRETALAALARLSEAESSGALAQVGEATETLADITLRLNAYVTLLPKVAGWQAELVAQDITGRDDLRSALDNVDAIGTVARRANDLLSDLPGTAREASGPINELIDRQRTEIMAAIDRERATLTAFVTSERQAALGAIGQERQAAMEGIGKERAAALAGVDAIARRSLEDASARARGVVDYVFIRALILIAAAAVLFAVAYRVARGSRRYGGGGEGLGANR